MSEAFGNGWGLETISQIVLFIPDSIHPFASDNNVILRTQNKLPCFILMEALNSSFMSSIHLLSLKEDFNFWVFGYHVLISKEKGILESNDRSVNSCFHLEIIQWVLPVFVDEVWVISWWASQFGMLVVDVAWVWVTFSYRLKNGNSLCDWSSHSSLEVNFVRSNSWEEVTDCWETL